MKSDRDPIVAIATAPGRGGVGIVRLSASDELVKRFVTDFFAGQGELKPRYAHLRKFLDESGNAIDEGLALYFPAPRSYTGESVLELQGHGGPVVLQMLLSRMLMVGKSIGLRIADPGEFTKRAFLNGRLDLSQAEAVADLIDATTEGAARAATRSLTGVFSQKIHHLTTDLIELRALIEAILDFPEEEIDFIKTTQSRERISKLHADFSELMKASRQGSILREGVTVVLVGSPNVGKSSLMNALSGSDVAIVTEIAGTTRDKIEHDIQIQGVPIRLIDTAGVRDTDDKVEKMGIERTMQAVERADVVLHLKDATNQLSDDEGNEILQKVVTRLRRGGPILDILNKCDVARATPQEGIISISAKTGLGVDELKQRLLAIVGWESNTEGLFLARERHMENLYLAKEHLDIAQQFVSMDYPPLDLLAEELRLAGDALGDIVGETTPDDLLGMIFSRFCIGK